MSFKVLVVGAGAQGKTISTWMSRWPEATEVRLADIDEAAAVRHAERLASPKVTTHLVDASEVDAVTALADGADLLVAAVTPPFVLGLMDAALACGTDYMDLAFGPPYELFEKQLAKDAAFKDAGLTALLCAGQSPGLTDLFASHAADTLDSLESIRIRMYDSVEGDAALATWSAETLYGDFSLRPLVVRDGELTTVPTFSGAETYTFPPPFGEREIVQHIHEEILLMQHYLGHTGLKNIDLKLGAPDVAEIKTIIDSGLWSDEPVDLDGTKVIPRRLMSRLLPPTPSADEIEAWIESGELIDSAGILIVEIDGRRDGDEITHTYTVSPPTLRTAHAIIPGATHESYVTGTAAAVFAKALGEGKVTNKGVISADVFDAEEREYMLRELALVDIRARLSVSTWLD